MKTPKGLNLFLVSIFSAGLLLSNGLFATTVSAACDKRTVIRGIPAWYAYLDLNEDSDGRCKVELDDKPIEGSEQIKKAVPLVVIALVDGLLRIAGLVAFIFIVLSGFRFVFAQGDVNKEKEARSALFNAVIGMLIAMFAAFIVTFIGKRLSS